MGALGQDIRFAIRTLWKSPTFTAIALLALALGIGANSAIFTVVNSVVLQPLPFPDSQRLYSLSVSIPSMPFLRDLLFDPDRVALEQQATSYEQIGCFSRGRTSMTGIGEPLPVHGWEVNPGFWSTLGVSPALGRTFLPSEKDGQQTPVVVLSDYLWRTHFRADRSIVGKVVRLDGNPHTIIGVMPARFQLSSTYLPSADLWTPLIPPSRGNVMARKVIARLKPGVTSEQARAEMQTIISHVQARLPNRQNQAVVVSLQESMVGDVRPSLLILLGAVGFILLIACANVANLMLTRGAGRRQEIAVRASLGATRARLARLLLTESSILALAGGALGLLVALWAVPILLKLTPPQLLPRYAEVSINAQVLGFTLLLSLATSLLFGIAPALQLSKARLAEFLKQDDRRLTGGQRMRSVLVVAEIALSLVLLIGAGLMIKSFVHLRSIDPGFKPERVMIQTVDLPDRPQRTVEQMIAYHQQVLNKFAGLPGVIAAGAINWLPMENALVQGTFRAEDRPASSTKFTVSKPGVSPGYFSALGIPLLRGRAFDEHDTAGSAGVVVLSQSTARAIWGNEEPIGRRITLEDTPKSSDWLTVVGVVDDVKQLGLAEKKPIPAIYQPLNQVTHSFFLGHMAYVVRTNANPSVVAGLMRSRFRELDPNQPIQQIATMDDLLDANTAQPRFYSRILGSFSGVALLLAGIGIYGVMAYTVAQRTREIGIRIALGAEPGKIFRTVIGRSASLILIGVAAGLAGAFAVTRVLTKLLFEIKPTDPATFAVVTAVLVLIALLASYIPARRATSVDPMVALRYE
jgi:putative ABC transport system permease protein